MALSVTPASAPPGTILKATGFGQGFSTSDVVVEIGGEFSPASADSSGDLLCAVPLFLGEGGDIEPPEDPVDLVVKRDGNVIGEAKSAVTVADLPAANGAARELSSELDTVFTAVQRLMSSFAPTPGAQQQYVTALTAAMDSLLHGGGEWSLASAAAAIPEGSTEERLADHLASANGVAEFVEKWADYLTSLDADLRAREMHRGRARARSATRVSDEELARMMEFYTVVMGLANLETGPYSRSMLSAVGKVETLLGTSGEALEHVQVRQGVLGFFTEIAFYILPGTLPAELDTFDLTVLQDNLSPGDTTETRILLTASNDPPRMNLNRLIDVAIVNLCDSLTAPLAQQLRDKLEDMAALFTGIMEAKVAQYAALYPELTLNHNLTEDVPDMFWSVDATSPLLYNRQSAPPNIVMPCASVMEWYVLPDVSGATTLTVATSTSPSGWLLPQMPGVPPYLGSFGDATKTSSSGVVHVANNVTLSLTAAISPAKILLGQTGILTVQAQYQGGSGSTPAADVAISVAAQGGGVNPPSGSTDAGGLFQATVTPNQGADTVVVVATGSGIGGSSAQATAKATVEEPGPLWNCRGREMYYEASCPEKQPFVITFSYNPATDSVSGSNYFVSNYDPVNHWYTIHGVCGFKAAAGGDGFSFRCAQAQRDWYFDITVKVFKDSTGACACSATSCIYVENP